MIDEEESLREQFLEVPPLSEEVAAQRTDRVREKESLIDVVVNRTGAVVEQVGQLFQAHSLKLAPFGDKRCLFMR